MSPEQVENWLRKFDNIAKSQDIKSACAYRVPAKKPVKLNGADIVKMLDGGGCSQGRAVALRESRITLAHKHESENT
jgi:hypothetical protein